MMDEPDEGRRRRRRAGAPALATGVALVLLGVLFLLQNEGMLRPSGNWWAFFLLVPAVALAGTALSRYQAADGRLTADARGALTAAVFLGALALSFLLDVDWGMWWPAFIVLAGVAVLLNWGSVARGAGHREP
jgi:hypothetical protein